MTENPSATFRGTVAKIITSRGFFEPEKAQISVDGADPLYKELRINNTLTDEDGKEVRLKQGSHRGDYSRGRATGNVNEER